MLDNEKIKIINFLQDFGYAKLNQLQILFNKPNDNFKDILSSNLISKKQYILVHNTATIDIKMIYALDIILCKYKNKFKHFHKGYEPVYITLEKSKLKIIKEKNKENNKYKNIHISFDEQKLLLY